MTHLSRLATPTPADLGALKSAAWSAIRRFNATGLASDAAAASVAARAVEEAQEAYRLAHHPNALAVFAICDEERGQACQVYAVFPTGPECVFEAHGDRVA